VFDIEPMHIPSMTLLTTFSISQVLLIHNFYNWSDNTYMNILETARVGASVVVVSTSLKEENDIKYFIKNDRHQLMH